MQHIHLCNPTVATRKCLHPVHTPSRRSCIYNHSSPSRQLTTWTAVYGHSSFVFYYVQDVARWRIGTTSGSDTLTTGTTVPCTTPAPYATPVAKFALHQPSKLHYTSPKSLALHQSLARRRRWFGRRRGIRGGGGGGRGRGSGGGGVDGQRRRRLGISPCLRKARKESLARSTL